MDADAFKEEEAEARAVAAGTDAAVAAAAAGLLAGFRRIGGCELESSFRNSCFSEPGWEAVEGLLSLLLVELLLVDAGLAEAADC